MWHWLAARRVCSVWLACEEKWLWKGFESESKLYAAGKGCVRSLCQRKQSQSACLVQNNSIKFHILLWNKHSLSNMAPNLEEVFHIKDLHRTLQFIPHFMKVLAWLIWTINLSLNVLLRFCTWKESLSNIQRLLLGYSVLWWRRELNTDPAISNLMLPILYPTVFWQQWAI